MWSGVGAKSVTTGVGAKSVTTAPGSTLAPLTAVTNRGHRRSMRALPTTNQLDNPSQLSPVCNQAIKPAARNRTRPLPVSKAVRRQPSGCMRNVHARWWWPNPPGCLLLSAGPSVLASPHQLGSDRETVCQTTPPPMNSQPRPASMLLLCRKKKHPPLHLSAPGRASQLAPPPQSQSAAAARMALAPAGRAAATTALGPGW